RRRRRRAARRRRRAVARGPRRTRDARRHRLQRARRAARPRRHPPRPRAPARGPGRARRAERRQRVRQLHQGHRGQPGPEPHRHARPPPARRTGGSGRAAGAGLRGRLRPAAGRFGRRRRRLRLRLRQGCRRGRGDGRRGTRVAARDPHEHTPPAEPTSVPPSTLRRLTGGLAGAAVVIAVITVLSRLAGFGRTYAFSQTVTTSCLSQAYFTSTQFPFIVYEIVAGGALTAMVVPVLAGAAERGDRDEVRRIGSALLTWIVVLMIPLSALMALAARPIMELLVGGDLQGCSRDGIVDVGSSMLRILSAQMVMYGVAVVLYGVLQSHRRFVASALAPLMSSLVVIVAYAAYAPLGRD